MELSARKKQILKRVIEDYIASAEPVGSKAIAQEMGGSVSSATVRNELAELSDLGYLEQPHTSAGRVPSPKGYRLYVNELMERREVSEAEAEAAVLRNSIENSRQSAERMRGELSEQTERAAGIAAQIDEHKTRIAEIDEQTKKLEADAASARNVMDGRRMRIENREREAAEAQGCTGGCDSCGGCE